MDPVRSSIGGGIAATIVLSVVLIVADVLLGANALVFATFTSLCSVGGPPYCELGSATSYLITYVFFFLLFAVAWPLLFGGFTWGLPGETGIIHGLVYGIILWSGYAVVVLYGIRLGGETISQDLPFLVFALVGYLLYGAVLGAGYDRLAGHRTFLRSETVA